MRLLRSLGPLLLVACGASADAGLFDDTDTHAAGTDSDTVETEVCTGTRTWTFEEVPEDWRPPPIRWEALDGALEAQPYESGTT